MGFNTIYEIILLIFVDFFYNTNLFGLPLQDKLFMKRSIIGFTTLLAATLAMTNAVYASEQDDKQAIIESYRTVDAGFQHNNLNQAFSFYAPEFTQVEMDGKVENLEDIRYYWLSNPQNSRHIQIMHEPQLIKINGQTATVVETAYISTFISNPNNPQVPIAVSTVLQSQDTWKLTNSGWKVTNARILQSNTTRTQQSSQVNRKKLTPAQQIEIMRYYLQVIRNNSRY